MSYEEIKHSDGSFKRVWRTEDGKPHREDGPAIINYNSECSIIAEYFYLNGKCHRESGPAYISYYPDGSILLVVFYLNAKFLGTDKKGFWNLWDSLTEDKRRSPELLRYFVSSHEL